MNSLTIEFFNRSKYVFSNESLNMEFSLKIAVMYQNIFLSMTTIKEDELPIVDLFLKDETEKAYDKLIEISMIYKINALELLSCLIGLGSVKTTV